MQQLGLANMDQLQGWFTSRVADHLVKLGRTPVGWDDPLIAGVKLPASQVVMSWHGGDERRVVLEQDHDVVLAPPESLYFDYYQSDLPDEWQGQPPMTTLRQAYDTAVIPSGATAAQAKRIIGVQGNLWTELMPRFANVQHALFPRIAALSEVGWSAASSHDWNGFLAAPARRARALSRTRHRLCRHGVCTCIRCHCGSQGNAERRAFQPGELWRNSLHHGRFHADFEVHAVCAPAGDFPARQSDAARGDIRAWRVRPRRAAHAGVGCLHSAQPQRR